MVLIAFCTIIFFFFFFSNMAILTNRFVTVRAIANVQSQSFGRKNIPRIRATNIISPSSPSSIVSFIIICFALGRVPRLISMISLMHRAN